MMGKDNYLETLFNYAKEYRFVEFREHLARHENNVAIEERLEAYLFHIEIKLFAADPSLQEDLNRFLEMEEVADFTPKYPILNSVWGACAQNRISVFSPLENNMALLLKTLPELLETFERLFGKAGTIPIRQMWSEILYFRADIECALYLASEQYEFARNSPMDRIMALCVTFRCYLALGLGQQAEAAMLEMFKLSQNYPECVAPYQTIRTWTNLTTNWCGDTPRYYYNKRGEKCPSLEDRLVGIRQGIGESPPCEMRFVELAKCTYENAYPLRSYYLDIFDAMCYNQIGEVERKEQLLMSIYEVSCATGLLMPLIEYGQHIVPLIGSMRGQSNEFDKWANSVISKAEQYESGLCAYCEVS